MSRTREAAEPVDRVLVEFPRDRGLSRRRAARARRRRRPLRASGRPRRGAVARASRASLTQELAGDTVTIEADGGDRRACACASARFELGQVDDPAVRARARARSSTTCPRSASRDGVLRSSSASHADRRRMTHVATDLDFVALLEAYRAGDERRATRSSSSTCRSSARSPSRYSGRGRAARGPRPGRLDRARARDRAVRLERGVQFTTYAVPTIVGEIQRHFRDRAWAAPRAAPDEGAEPQARRARSRARRPSSAGRPRSPSSPRTTGRRGGRGRRGARDVPRVLDALAVAAARATATPTRGSSRTCSARPSAGSTRSRTARSSSPGSTRSTSGSARIVELRFFEGLTQSEIAARVGISQMHVSRLLAPLARRDARPPRGPATEEELVSDARRHGWRSRRKAEYLVLARLALAGIATRGADEEIDARRPQARRDRGCGNAVRHAYAGGPGVVDVRVRRRARVRSRSS